MPTTTTCGPMINEYRRLGGILVLGHPAGRAFQREQKLYQPFEKALLQWDIVELRAELAPIAQWLGLCPGSDELLDSCGLPRITLPEADDVPYAIIDERQAWLTNPAITSAYLAGGGAARYGLPYSKPERCGPWVAQWFERYLMLQRVDGVPEGPLGGAVDGFLLINILRDVGLVPKEHPRATTPQNAAACTIGAA
jgi:hypothetical protein